MAWTYSGDPTASALDEVRFLIGDTDEDDQLLQDGEVLYAVGKQPDARLAGAICCDSIAAKFSRWADSAVGDDSESASQRAIAYRAQAANLRTDAATNGAGIRFGGISHAEKQALDANSDSVQPSFRVGMDDNPRAPSERRRSESDPYNF